MIRVVVLYEQEPDGEQYAVHAELCRAVPGGVFRHGRVFGTPHGKPAHAYYAEWEFPDMAAFEAAAQSDEFAATGRDARDRGLPRPLVQFLELD